MTRREKGWNEQGIRMSETQYNIMLKDQGNRCAICFKHEKTFSRLLAVDHNHETGIVRGILCNNCNTMIGMALESEDILLEAINYLKQYR